MRTSLTNSILNHYVADIPGKERRHDEVYEALEKTDMVSLERSFAALGLDVRPEESNNNGRIDMIVHFESKVYVIEFRVNELTREGRALAQIKEKKYHQKFTGQETYLVGVEFSNVERNISRFEWERVEW